MAGPAPLPCFPFSADPAPFGTEWASLQGPTPGSIDAVYQFQGSTGGPAGVHQGSTDEAHAGSTITSQVRGFPSNFPLPTPPPAPTPCRHIHPNTPVCILCYGPEYVIQTLFHMWGISGSLDVEPWASLTPCLMPNFICSTIFVQSQA